MEQLKQGSDALCILLGAIMVLRHASASPFSMAHAVGGWIALPAGKSKNSTPVRPPAWRAWPSSNATVKTAYASA
jgi:hypothetical protein